MPARFLDLPTPVREHPSPSARLAWLALREADEPLAIDTLAAETGASGDRIRRVLGTLQDVGLVEQRDHPADSRRNVYTTDDSARQRTDDTSGLSTPSGGQNLSDEAGSTGFSPSNPRGGER